MTTSETSLDDLTPPWLTVDQVTERLGVRPETVYAYVSRGVLDRRRAPDGRRSLFRATQVEQLARRGRPRVATQRSEPIDVPIRTSVAGVEDGVLRYRGIDVAELLDAGFESVAGLLLLGEPHPVALRWGPSAAPVAPGSPSVFDRFALSTAWAAAADPGRSGSDRAAVVRAGQELLPALVAAAGSAAGPGRRTVAERLATNRFGRRHREAGALVDAALVLLADHELASSTMAVRVAASTRADPYMCVLAGIAALSGPLHGSASRATHDLVRRTVDDGAEATLRDALRGGRRVPGFGHVLYRGDDPRAVLLLERWRSVAPAAVVAQVDRLIELVDDHAGVRPNVDLALGVVSATIGGGADFGEVVFTIGRTAGWLAHVAEEYDEPGLRFRPRRLPGRATGAGPGA